MLCSSYLRCWPRQYGNTSGQWFALWACRRFFVALQRHMCTQSLNHHSSCDHNAICLKDIATKKNTHEYPYIVHVTDDLPCTLAHLYIACGYEREGLVMIFIGLRRTTEATPLLSTHSSMSIPFDKRNDNLCSPIDISGLLDSLYTWINFWLGLDHIT